MPHQRVKTNQKLNQVRAQSMNIIFFILNILNIEALAKSSRSRKKDPRHLEPKGTNLQGSLTGFSMANTSQPSPILSGKNSGNNNFARDGV